MAAAGVMEPADFAIDDSVVGDKEGEWKYPMDNDGWMHSHNSIRAEVAIFEEALGKVIARGDVLQWEVDAIKAFWAHHSHHVHTHHASEEEIMNPFLKTRIKLPEKLETDHEDVVSALKKATGLAEALAEGDKGAVEALAATVTEYRDILLPHLKEEEEQGLPLMRAFFTPAEVAPKVQEIIKKQSPLDMGAFIHTMGRDAFRKGFMAQEGIPFFVWHIQFKGQLREYQAKIVTATEALVSGTKPEPPAGGVCVIV
mmetsp:Transcript_3973/g.10008  ORF Transcript_3973/g.10008 Transcript_3973/m.10008 type:complete len:256 (+) Transcript_3973:32-799(+)